MERVSCFFFLLSHWWHISNTKVNSWKNFHFHFTRYVLQDFTSVLESRNEHKLTEGNERQKNKEANIRKKPDGTRETIYFRIGNNSTWKSNYSRYALQVELSKISLLTALIQFGVGVLQCAQTHRPNGPKIRYHCHTAYYCYHTLTTALLHPSYVQCSLIYVIALVSAKIKQQNTHSTERTPSVYALMHTLQK